MYIWNTEKRKKKEKNLWTNTPSLCRITCNRATSFILHEYYQLNKKSTGETSESRKTRAHVHVVIFCIWNFKSKLNLSVLANPKYPSRTWLEKKKKSCLSTYVAKWKAIMFQKTEQRLSICFLSLTTCPWNCKPSSVWLHPTVGMLCTYG